MTRSGGSSVTHDEENQRKIHREKIAVTRNKTQQARLITEFPEDSNPFVERSVSQWFSLCLREAVRIIAGGRFEAAEDALAGCISILNELLLSTTIFIETVRLKERNPRRDPSFCNVYSTVGDKGAALVPFASSFYLSRDIWSSFHPAERSHIFGGIKRRAQSENCYSRSIKSEKGDSG